MEILQIPTEKSIERKVHAPRKVYGTAEYEAMREAVARCYFHFKKRRTLIGVMSHANSVPLISEMNAACEEYKKHKEQATTFEQTVAITSDEPEWMLSTIRYKCERITAKAMREGISRAIDIARQDRFNQAVEAGVNQRMVNAKEIAE